MHLECSLLPGISNSPAQLESPPRAAQKGASACFNLRAQDVADATGISFDSPDLGRLHSDKTAISTSAKEGPCRPRERAARTRITLRQVTQLVLVGTEIHRLARLDDLWTSYLTANQNENAASVDLDGLDFLAGMMAEFLPQVVSGSGVVADVIFQISDDDLKSGLRLLLGDSEVNAAERDAVDDLLLEEDLREELLAHATSSSGRGRRRNGAPRVKAEELVRRTYSGPGPSPNLSLRIDSRWDRCRRSCRWNRHRRNRGSCRTGSCRWSVLVGINRNPIH